MDDLRDAEILNSLGALCIASPTLASRSPTWFQVFAQTLAATTENHLERALRFNLTTAG